jgi:hypothetical protein
MKVTILDDAISRNQAGVVIELSAKHRRNEGHRGRKTDFNPTPPHLVLIKGSPMRRRRNITATITDLMRMTFGPPAFLNVDRAFSLAYLSILPSYLKLRMPWRAKIFSTKSNIEVPVNSW